MTTPSQAAVAAAKEVKELFLMRHWAHVAEEEIAEIIDRHIATDRAGWQGFKQALREVELFTRHNEDCNHNALLASARRCTCGRDAAWQSLIEAAALAPSES